MTYLEDLAAEQAAAAAAVLVEITSLTNAAAWPALSDDQLADLVLKSRRCDKYGRVLDDPYWLPTYHISYGVYRGWQLKCALCATAYDYGDGQVKFDRSQALKGCQEMVKMYAKKLASSPVTISTQRTPITPIPAFPVGPVIMPTEFEQGNS